MMGVGVTALLLSVSVGILVVVIEFFWRKRWQYYHSLKFNGPLSFPIIGNAYKLIPYKGDFLQATNKLFEQYPDLFKLWLGEKLVIMSTRPNDVKLAGKIFLEKDADFYEHVVPITGDSLVTAQVTKWRRHRRIVAPALNKKSVDSFVEIFGKCSEGLVEDLRQHCGKGDFNIASYLLVNSARGSLSTLLGTFFESNEKPAIYIEEGTRLTSILPIRMIIGRFSLLPLWNFTEKGKEFSRLTHFIKDYFRQIVSKKVQQLTNSSAPVKASLISQLVNTMNKDDTWNQEELVEIFQTVIGVGTDSSGSSIGFTLLALATHPSIQDKIYEEQFTIFGNSDRNSTSEDIHQMTYLEQVLNESMRMFPPAPIFARAVTKDTQLDDGYLLPRGCTFAVNIMAVHRNPKYWRDPLTFDPDRFSPEENAKRLPGTFIPFSVGARNCPGFHYAMAAMKVFMSKILRHYKVTSSVKSLLELDVSFNIAIKLEGGCFVALEPRLCRC